MMLAKNKKQKSLWVVCILFYSLSVFSEDFLHESQLPFDQLNLLVIEIVTKHPPYEEFCRRKVKECELRGPKIIELTPEVQEIVQDTNTVVNEEIRFVLDIEQYNREEYWNIPNSGKGDCEDMALLKRKKLYESGIPKAAMRLAIVFHKKFLSSHCVLTLETTTGTYVLDSFTNDVVLWHQTLYNFELRERPDGAWERFDQSVWKYEP